MIGENGYGSKWVVDLLMRHEEVLSDGFCIVKEGLSHMATPLPVSSVGLLSSMLLASLVLAKKGSSGNQQ